MVVKVGFAPVLAVVMLGAMTFGANKLQQSQTQELERVVTVDMPASLRMQKLAERITSVHGNLYMLLTNQAANIEAEKIPAQGAELLKEVDAITRDLKVAEATAPASQKADFQKLTQNLADTRGALDIIVSMMSADFSAAAGFAAPFETEYAKMNATLQSIVTASQKAVDAQAAEARKRSQAMQALFLAVCGATILAVAGVALFLVMNMRDAVRRIAGATETLSKGDNSVDLDKLARRDELGAIVKSLNVFRDNQVRLGTMRQDQEAAARARAEEQAIVVDSLAAALEALAHGDLTARITATFPGEYDKLRSDYNAAVEKLGEAVGSIRNSTTKLRSGCSEIASGAENLSHRTEQQAASLEETAAAVDEITATVQRSAGSATQSKEAVEAAKADAERSGEVVRRAVVAMNEIERSAQEISKIIGVVDEIAFQTNLLALNAGVEAARAGDAGKGFAVVASEVRALAQRSAESAKQIKQLISTSASQVSEGVALVGEAGASLNRIVEHVNGVAILVAEIATSAKEEAVSLREVNTAMNEMDTVTQQNAALVEQTTAASRMLAGTSDELFSMVSRFRIDQADEPAAGARRARTATRPVTRSVGNLAVQTDEWEEI
jgi:methyl-accepting chemotaxis protein